MKKRLGLVTGIIGAAFLLLAAVLYVRQIHPGYVNTPYERFKAQEKNNGF